MKNLIALMLLVSLTGAVIAQTAPAQTAPAKTVAPAGDKDKKGHHHHHHHHHPKKDAVKK